MGEINHNKEIAVIFIKTALTRYDNRCDKCGRRLKFKPGGLIAFSGRFMTCRSCGFENPTYYEKVLENITEAGIPLPDPEEGLLDLPQCMGCGVELQVSRDFTKVFCSSCGREWGRYEYEDLMEEPLNPALAGKLPFLPDDSKTASELADLLEANDVDYGTVYATVKLDVPDSNAPVSFREALKQGWREGMGQSAPVKKEVPRAFLALHEDYVASYTFKENEVETIESKFEDIFSEGQTSVDFGFQAVAIKAKELNFFNERLDAFRVIHLANLKPFENVLFGSAAKEAELEAQASKQQSPKSEVTLSGELQNLASLRDQGLINDVEFEAAKKKLLGL